MSEKIRFLVSDCQVKSVDGKVSRRLSSSEIAIFIALIKAQGAILSREELMSIGWPGKVVVANSLNMAILSLRRALHIFGKDKNIVTIPRIGFRLEQSELFSCESLSGKTDIENDDFVDPQEVAAGGTANDATEHRGVGCDLVSFVTPESTNLQHQQENDHLITAISPQLTPLERPAGYVAKFPGLRLVVTTFICGITILVLAYFVWWSHEANEPRWQCQQILTNARLCAEHIDSVNTNILQNKIEEKLQSTPNKKYEVWLEHNPHHSNGYQLYYFEIE